MVSAESDKKNSSGISLSDLPEEDLSLTAQDAITRKIESIRNKKKIEAVSKLDERSKTLSSLGDEEKLKVMTQVYEFDKKNPRFELLFIYFIPIILKYSGFFSFFNKVLRQPENDAVFVVGPALAMLDIFHSVAQYSELIAIFFIVIKPPIQSTRLRFLLNFEGLDVPTKLRFKVTDSNLRRKVKWAQISSVEFNEEFIPGIKLLDEENQILGVVRWDLWRKDKKTLLRLLKKYVGDKHPLRKFVENELGEI